MCNVLLPPGGNPIAVNKYIITYKGNSKINLRLVDKKKHVVIGPKRKLSSNK